MNFVIYTNALLLMGIGLILAGNALVFHETRSEFLTSALLVTLFGGLLSLAVSNRLERLGRLHTFLMTASVWITAAAAGALPMWLWKLSLTDAFFESMSGLTTTGSTVIVGLDAVPPGILMWRATLHWIGGIGFIVVGIAFLPILRVGGMQLFRTESSERGDKEMASAARFAGATVWIYVTLTALCGAVYSAGGMSAFNAVAHAFATISTGGFSTSDSSFAQFQSPFLEWTCVVFMIAGALPFAWYIRVIRTGRFDSEQVRTLLRFFALTIMTLTIWRVTTADAPVFETLRLVAFNVVSVVTTTGFATTDYLTWGPFAACVFLGLTCVGGCTGSTSGGAKMMRWIIFVRLMRSLVRKGHSPNAVVSTVYEGHSVAEDVLSGVMTFFVLYALTVVGLAFLLGITGLDLATALSGALTAVANVGPGIGPVIGPAGTFASLPDSAKWLLSAGMYLGRLEMLTVYVLLTAGFWRELA